VRILTVLARFGTEHYERAEQEIDDIFRSQLPEVERTVVVVDNALSAPGAAPRGPRQLIAGDNSAREFSGFDRALAAIGGDIAQFDLVHFATSAFNRLYVGYLERFDTRVVQSIIGRPVCLGHIDAYNEPVAIRGFHSQHWIRTGFFMLPPSEVRILGSFVSLRHPENLFSRNPAAPFRRDAPLSETYRRYILDWLAGGDIGQGVTWHSHFQVTEETLAEFEQKALSILNEHLLSIRLRAGGCRLIDVTWAATMLGRGDAASVPWRTNWRLQLAGRDRGALILPACNQTQAGLATAQPDSRSGR
jgi:hypothetical protein